MENREITVEAKEVEYETYGQKRKDVLYEAKGLEKIGLKGRWHLLMENDKGEPVLQPIDSDGTIKFAEQAELCKKRAEKIAEDIAQVREQVKGIESSNVEVVIKRGLPTKDEIEKSIFNSIRNRKKEVTVGEVGIMADKVLEYRRWRDAKKKEEDNMKTIQGQIKDILRK